MPRTNVKVIVRARPTAHYASENFQFSEATDSIDMRLTKDDKGGQVNNQKESWHFKLDKVLPNAGQEQVFDICAAEVCRSVMDGYNGTILAYGQTGAGKTHTMTGGHVGFADRGIVPRCISSIYADSAARPESNIVVRLSYAEIYNELTFDLLNDIGVTDQAGDLAIVEDARGNIQVKGLTMMHAATEEEALHIFFQGDTNRHVAEHALNKASTRSHCVFTIYVESRSRVESSEKVTFSKLNLVDLAGSERVKKTGTDGLMLKEATYINKSLSFLEQVVVALGDKHRDHVPYRQSKLTHMLKDSLGGNCKTTMIANVWPEANKIEETASTLHFATRMMRVSNEASVNVHLDPQLLIRKYERQIKDLRQELAMHDTLAGRSRVQYEEYSPDEKREMEQKVRRYLEGEVQELEVASLRMVYETFAIFRSVHIGLRKELAERPFSSAPGGGSEDTAGKGATGGSGQPGAQHGGVGVGEDEEGRGISVGEAPQGSRPYHGDQAQAGSWEQHDAAEGRTEFRGAGTQAAGARHGEQHVDKQAAFVEWKAKEGLQYEEDFESNRAQLRDCKAQMKETLALANAKKRDIDAAKERLARKQADKRQDADEELIDEEEYALIKTLRDTKQQYKDAFEKSRQVKSKMSQIESYMGNCKAKLVSAFEDWYDQRYGHIQRAAVAATLAREADGDAFDPQEQFDRAQAERLETQHPDALAYHKARKTAARDVRRKGGR